MEIASVLRFLGKTWKVWLPLLALVVLVLYAKNYIDGVREEGRQLGVQQQYKVDKEAQDKRDKERNEKIDALEARTKTLADTLDTLNRKATQTIANLNKQLVAKQKELDQTRYNADGTIAKACTEGATLYLGHEFSTDWNKYNSGVLTQ